MRTNIRDFTRNFAAYRSAAKSGKPIEILDREGVSYVFAIKKPAPASLAEAVSHLAGIVETGIKKKSLAGYGRR